MDGRIRYLTSSAKASGDGGNEGETRRGVTKKRVEGGADDHDCLGEEFHS